MRTINIQIDVVYSFRKGFQGGGAWLRPFFYNHLALWELFAAKEEPELLLFSVGEGSTSGLWVKLCYRAIEGIILFFNRIVD